MGGEESEKTGLAGEAAEEFSSALHAAIPKANMSRSRHHPGVKGCGFGRCLTCPIAHYGGGSSGNPRGAEREA